jgi:hypothetical protein
MLNRERIFDQFCALSKLMDLLPEYVHSRAERSKIRVRLLPRQPAGYSAPLVQFDPLKLAAAGIREVPITVKVKNQ